MRGDGSYDTSHPGANWKLLIPAQAQGATVDYQLFTRNQQGNDYGFTGFTWSYTVAASGLVHNTFDTAYRAPGGAVPAGSSVVLKLAAKPGMPARRTWWSTSTTRRRTARCRSRPIP